MMYRAGYYVRPGEHAEVLASIGLPYFNRTYEHFCSHGPTPFEKVSHHPAVVRSGRVVYFAHPVFSIYAGQGARVYRRLVQNALDLLLGGRLVQSNLPSTARVALNRQPAEDRLVLHVLNYAPERRAPDLDIIEEAVGRLQVHDAEVQLLLLIEKPHQVVPQYLCAADVLVLASDFEGSPIVIKEAMACNLPIVSTDVGDVADLIGDTEGCYLCKQTAEDVADKLRRALSFGRRTEGRRAVQHLSLPAIADRIIEVYREVLA